MFDVEGGALDQALSRIVAAEISGVDHDAGDGAGQAQADDADIASGRAAAACLPAVHPLAVVGVLMLAPLGGVRPEQIFLGGEELVVGPHGPAAQRLAGQIGKVGEVTHNSFPPRAPISAPSKILWPPA